MSYFKNTECKKIVSVSKLSKKTALRPEKCLMMKVFLSSSSIRPPIGHVLRTSFCLGILICVFDSVINTLFSLRKFLKHISCTSGDIWALELTNTDKKYYVAKSVCIGHGTLE